MQPCGNEEVIGAFIYFETMPKGRHEAQIMEWSKRNDEDVELLGASCCHAAASG
jgi:predicted dithiol-disulfide oxidoreductase (DUF899 family)